MSDEPVIEVVDEDNESFIDIDKYFGLDENDSDPDRLSDDEVEIRQTKDSKIVIGIDLGTTNSCVGIWRNNNLEIIPDRYGNRTIPSVVSFTNRSRYIGRDAKNQMELNPENTFYEVKRLIGRKYNDESVNNDKEFLTYEIESGEDDNINIIPKLDGKKRGYTPEEISSHVLRELKMMAEDYLQQDVEEAVITVPAYFNDAQRQATKDAATIAGLDCIRIINEPTAAALAYGYLKLSMNRETDMNILVYDAGGGTLDCSIVNISDGLFEVKASTGNTHMGGFDFDKRLYNHCKTQFMKKHKINKLTNISCLSLQKLKKACERAKRLLSEKGTEHIAVKDFYDGKDLLVTITRKEFEYMCRDLLIFCLNPINDVLRSSDLDREEIDEIILVGGLTRMPVIRQNIKHFFSGKEPISTINPDEVVAAGAALQGYLLANKDDPFSENVVILDVIPLSLGVEVIGGVMNTLIPSGSVIPIRRKKKYTTDADFETSVRVKVYEGEREMTKDNFLVGEFVLRGIEPEPRGMAELMISFNVDINGIISITAEDLKNEENKNSININSNKGRLSTEKIKELLREAKEFSRQDKIDRNKKQKYYEIDDLCSNVLINIKSEDIKLNENDRKLVTEDIEKFYDWLKEKPYNERNIKEYEKTLKKLKRRYGTLILKMGQGDFTAKAEGECKNTAGTTVFGDEDDEENIYEELENEELGILDMGDDDKRELKRIRNDIVDMCYSVIDILNCSSLKIEKDHINELKNYVNDVMLWVHISEKLKKIDYQQRIDEINKVCDDIMEKYQDKEIFEENEVTKAINTSRSELEQLCFAIKSSIMSNMFAVEEENLKQLDEIIDENLEWLLKLDVEKRKAELEEREFRIDNKEFEDRVNIINELCNNLYNSMTGLNINMINEDTDYDENTIILTDGHTTGTSILELQQHAQSN